MPNMSNIARLGRMASRVLVPKPVTSAANLGYPVRHSGAWVYRNAEQSKSKVFQNAATCVGTFLWTWILYHFYYEFDHITGEFEYPNPKEFTNEELGIPPDNEE